MKQFKEDGDQSSPCGRRSQPPAGRRSSRERVNRRPPQKFRLVLSINRLYIDDSFVKERSLCGLKIKDEMGTSPVSDGERIYGSLISTV